MQALLHLVEHVDAASKQHLAMGRKFRALRTPVEQPHAKRAFHLGYRLGDGGMGNPEPDGRLRHAAGIGDRHEDMQVAQFQATTNSIRPVHCEP